MSKLIADERGFFTVSVVKEGNFSDREVMPLYVYTSVLWIVYGHHFSKHSLLSCLVPIFSFSSIIRIFNFIFTYPNIHLHISRYLIFLHLSKFNFVFVYQDISV